MFFLEVGRKALRNSVEEVKMTKKLLFSDVMSMTHKSMVLLNLMEMRPYLY